ncbi:DUF885 domain-containing protein [Longimicrobium sp.]|uniref:DUF885 domain-containing protein n=1 Tax=Longimicrobium sp. TaxID=2029185 RepID=UPI002E3131B6|nr:DUF885 domain-containing protein [Longimicrobium sp.]HEX6037876.1 DUF885 domain-containing protein [Longimicrobium sp.]
MRSLRTAVLASATAVLCTGAGASLSAQSAPGDDAARVTALADEYVAAYRAAYPEEAELSGLARERHDGFTDNAPAALAAWRAREDAWAAALAGMDGAGLRGRPEWVTYGMLRERVEASRALRVCRQELWPVNQMSGWQANVATLAQVQPVGTPALRAQALDRFGRLPAYVDNEIAWLREGVRQGYTVPRRNVELVVQQLDAILSGPPEQSPFHDPAARDSTPEFRAAWAALERDALLPATRRYRDYLANEYLPAARETIGIGALPDGRACYQAMFRSYTTLDRAPEETFRLGEARVARNQAEVAEIGRRAWGTAALDSIRARVRGDRFANREEMMAFSREALERARGQVPRWFRTVPRAPVVIEPHPAFLEATASDQYFPAAEDGSRPAQYRINLGPATEKTRASAEITAFHETYPGHHLQIATAQEQPGAHVVSRLAASGSYLEGWARYAEALSEEMGLYTTDGARVDRRLWPARGMVVDPGLHLFGWTRAQAVEYIASSGRFDRGQAEALVDRVIAWPAQLTAYDTGGLEIFALREQAERALGDRFDIREFHDVLLRNGAVTLPMLRESVEAWIAGRR